MKKLSILYSLLFILAVSVASAQEFDVPKTGAKIFLSNASLELKATDETTFDLWVVRSKKAAKSKFDQPKFLGSQDFTFEVTPSASNPDTYKVLVKSNDVKPGAYFYTVSSRSRSTQKVTGTTISIKVGPEGQVVASDGN